MILLNIFALSVFLVQKGNAASLPVCNYSNQRQQTLYRQPIMHQSYFVAQQYEDPVKQIIVEKLYPQEAVIEQVYPPQITIDQKYLPSIGSRNLQQIYFGQPLPLQPNLKTFDSIHSQTAKIQQLAVSANQQPTVIETQCSKPVIVEPINALLKPYFETKLAQTSLPVQQPIYIQNVYPQTKTLGQTDSAPIVEHPLKISPVIFSPRISTPMSNVKPTDAQEKISVGTEKEVEAKSGSSAFTVFNVAGMPKTQPLIETVVVQPEPTNIVAVEQPQMQPQPIIYVQPRSCTPNPNIIYQRYA